MTEKELILLVDDDSSVRSFSALTLRLMGYQVLEAESGADALEKAQSLQSGISIDLLMTDRYMPKMNGIELAEKMRTMNPKHSILLTSGSSEEGIPTHLKNGPFAILLKPYTRDSLGKKIQEVLAIARKV